MDLVLLAVVYGPLPLQDHSVEIYLRSIPLGRSLISDFQFVCSSKLSCAGCRRVQIVKPAVLLIASVVKVGAEGRIILTFPVGMLGLLAELIIGFRCKFKTRLKATEDPRTQFLIGKTAELC